MKLKRIIAGITACTIVGSTMFTMPISARTTTKVEEVTLSDLLNTAKMVADLKIPYIRLNICCRLHMNI